MASPHEEAFETHSYQFKDLYNKITTNEKDIAKVKEKMADNDQTIKLLDWRMESQEKLTQSIFSMSESMASISRDIKDVLKQMSEHETIISEHDIAINDIKFKPLEEKVKISNEIRMLFYGGAIGFVFTVLGALIIGGLQ